MPSSKFSLVTPISDAYKNPKCGNQAKLLSQLAQNGFNIPRGFVVSSDAYLFHTHTASQVSGDTGKLIRENQLSEEIKFAIEEAYQKLAYQTGFGAPKIKLNVSFIDSEPKTNFKECIVSGFDSICSAITQFYSEIWNLNSQPAAIVAIQHISSTKRYTTQSIDTQTGNPNIIKITDHAQNIIYSFNLETGAFIEVIPKDQTALLTTLAEKTLLAEDIAGSSLCLEWIIEDSPILLDAKIIVDKPNYFPDSSVEDKWSFEKIGSIPISYFARDIIRQAAKSNNDITNDRARILNGYLYLKRDSEIVNLKNISKLISKWDSKLRVEISKVYINNSKLPDKLVKLARLYTDLISWKINIWNPSYWAMKDLKLKIEAKTGTCADWIMRGLGDDFIIKDAQIQELSDRLKTAQNNHQINNAEWWKKFKQEVDDFLLKNGKIFLNELDYFDISCWGSQIQETDTFLRILNLTALKKDQQTLVSLHQKSEIEFKNKISSLDSDSKLVKEIIAAREIPLRTMECDNAIAIIGNMLKDIIAKASEELSVKGIKTPYNDLFFLDYKQIAEALDGKANSEKITTIIAKNKHQIWLETRYNAPKFLGNSSQEKPLIINETKQELIQPDIKELSSIIDNSVLILNSPASGWSSFFGRVEKVILPDTCSDPILNCLKEEYYK